MSAQPLDQELPEDLKSLETALRQLTPSLGQLNRDRLMYLAGQASAEVGSQTPQPQNLASYWWPLSTAAASLLCFILGGILIFGKHGEQQIVDIDRSTLPTAEARSAGNEQFGRRSTIASNYFELRDLVSTQGLDAIVTPRTTRQEATSSDPLTWPELRDELLYGKMGG